MVKKQKKTNSVLINIVVCRKFKNELEFAEIVFPTMCYANNTMKTINICTRTVETILITVFFFLTCFQIHWIVLIKFLVELIDHCS